MEDFTSYLGVQTSVQKARVISSTSKERLAGVQRLQAADLEKDLHAWEDRVSQFKRSMNQ